MNNKCTFDQMKLSAYLDNEVDERERSEVENHVQRCRDCKEVLEAFRTNDLSFVDNVKHPLPAAYWDSHSRKLKEKILAQTRKNAYLRYVLPAAAVALIALTVFYAWTKYYATRDYESIVTSTVPGTTNPLKDIVRSTDKDHYAYNMAHYKEILKRSESVLIGIVNLDENSPEELAIIKLAVLQANLSEKIKELQKTNGNNPGKNSLKKLEALFILLQNEDSPDEVIMLKEIIIQKGLIEEIRAQQNSNNEVRL